MNVTPAQRRVQCLHPGGLHWIGYAEWGAADNPEVVVCLHGLTRTGRDFDLLAAVLAPRFRVVCPDMAGRGTSGWLADYRGYSLPQYVGDCVTLIARLGVERVHWVGTSMGGLIGMMIAAAAESPIASLVLNDVGPVLGRAGLERIGSFAGWQGAFDDFEAGVDYVSRVSATFGPHTRDEWRELASHIVVRRDGRWVLHYDPAITTATKEAMRAPTVDLWPLWDAIGARTLLLRGAQSDLLEASVAHEMTQRGPKPALVEFDGVGHAPSLMHDDQIAAVADFLAG
ncbi:MAG: alpha/beta fold hydrolase [Lautropia sp.]